MYLPQGEVDWTTKYYKNIRKKNTTGNGLPKLTVAVTYLLTQSNPYNQVAMHINHHAHQSTYPPRCAVEKFKGGVRWIWHRLLNPYWDLTIIWCQISHWDVYDTANIGGVTRAEVPA